MKNLIYYVAIVWQNNSGGTIETRLRTSVFPKNKTKVSSEEEALGKAIKEQRGEFDNPSHFTMLCYNITTTWQSEGIPDLRCLRYC